MPFYVYRSKDPKNKCAECKEGIELFQSIQEKPLESCPECGKAVARIFRSTPTVRDSSEKKILSDDNLKKNGFKKLVNRGGGKFDEVV